MYDITGFNKLKVYLAALCSSLLTSLLILYFYSHLPDESGYIGHYILTFILVLFSHIFLTFFIQKKIKKHSDIIKGLLHAISDVIVFKDYQGNFLFCNETVANLYKSTPEEMIGKDDYYFTKNKEQADFFRKNVQLIMDRFEKEEVYESSTDAKTNEVRHFHSVKIPFRDAQDKLKIAVIAKDITDITRLKEESERNKQRLQNVLDVSEEGLWEWNTVTNQVLHNRQWELITGIETSENTFAEFENAIAPEDIGMVRSALQALLTENKPYSIEFRMKRPDGEVIWVWDRGRVAEYDNEGKPTWLVGIALDITQKKLNQQKVIHLAYYDQLTGLANRTQLEIDLDKTIDESAREDSYSTLLFLDLDRFKLLNDSYGHHMGDKLLEAIAKRLTGFNQDRGLVSRFGGDEFVIILPLLDKSQKAATLKAQEYADSLIQDISRSLILSSDLQELEINYAITASIGGVVFKSADVAPGKLLQLSDIALYRAKANGGHSALIFDMEMQNELNHTSELQRAMRNSIEHRDFCIHLQPKLDSDERVVGAEALVRWQHPVLDLLYPNSFMEMAEESNMIIQIGAQVLEQSCQQLQKWQSHPETEHLKIAVNLSAKQLWQDQFVEEIIKTIASFDIDHTKLIFEVTESVLIQDINDATEKLSRLKEHGISISLDDFGTGYSSLNYLRSLPIDEIKIDRSFIKDVTSNDQANIMVKSIVDLASAFNLSVVSEGVEDREQFELLKKHHIDVYQGYYFSKPVPVSEFDEVICRDFGNCENH
ncbi:EAL domain-containing protein [Vibrio sp. JC009]|uniref:bifunctional diguanylate cyclase/phosphodiesterase n=1 Tax=Vibrio sp. JC009 TaxID=2912314 RepID=UPI0023B034ED|nr:bifunctional diguanylate cyclase/phosphodiesterase [Vibrio sp. JC009]WED23767.1 EAL domain-containing protein [Vibrio sp. JC009]